MMYSWLLFLSELLSFKRKRKLDACLGENFNEGWFFFTVFVDVYILLYVKGNWMN